MSEIIFHVANNVNDSVEGNHVNYKYLLQILKDEFNATIEHLTKIKTLTIFKEWFLRKILKHFLFATIHTVTVEKETGVEKGMSTDPNPKNHISREKEIVDKSNQLVCIG